MTTYLEAAFKDAVDEYASALICRESSERRLAAHKRIWALFTTLDEFADHKFDCAIWEYCDVIKAKVNSGECSCGYSERVEKAT